jgi:citrate lyase subunit alpha/citrate CoA-transferase
MSKPIVLTSIESLFDHIDIHQFKHISFHHHLRNGDGVINQVLPFYQHHNVQNIHLHPSAIFPSYTSILPLIKNGQIVDITTSYMNGEVADYISNHGLKGALKMTTHGSRARGILEQKERIDIAYLAVPTVDQYGNGTGAIGPSRCGSLGYAVADSEMAQIVVLITDHLVEETISHPDILGDHVDYIICIDSIGERRGIVSGTTQLTTNPIGVKIAHNAARALSALSVLSDGFSYQSGAGGVSLKVTDYLKKHMMKKHITASFFSGGITKYHVTMLESGLVKDLYDVQCFDLEAIESINTNDHHHAISASNYANPMNQDRIIKDLDIVILGATEIDCNFNVNVTTDSFNTIIGGSGGHSDVAEDASVTVVVSPLIKGRVPIVKDRVTTITTEGKHVDLFVTERGIAVNPNRTDLLEQLSKTTLKIVPIKALQEMAYTYTGHPKEVDRLKKEIGIIESRWFTITDKLYQKKG